jgi:pseudouridine-5'-phosphate glycosidase
MTAPLAFSPEVAAAHRMRGRLGLPGGQLVANPIPAAHEIPRAEMIPVIETALAEAAAAGIAAKEVTPFLLDRLAQLTSGRSLAANIALVRNNARLAAEIAAALAGSTAGRPARTTAPRPAAFRKRRATR